MPSSDNGSASRHFRLVEKACAAGPDCPYCGGTFTGVKVAKWCSPEAKRWFQRQERARAARKAGRIPGQRGRPPRHTPVTQWRCPSCGQLVFGTEAPFTCEFCGDAVTWQAWEV
ncbi:MAG: hypothetical protein Kow0077_32650 [Anaerolineae bacterium]